LISVQPNATLAELQQALPTRAALSTLWRAIDRLGLTVKQRYTPSNAGLLSRPRGGSGDACRPCATCASICFSTNAASRPISCVAMAAARAVRGSAITRPAVTGRPTPSLRPAAVPPRRARRL
jgi:hypothetical protein